MTDHPLIRVRLTADLTSDNGSIPAGTKLEAYTTFVPGHYKVRVDRNRWLYTCNAEIVPGARAAQ